MKNTILLLSLGFLTGAFTSNAQVKIGNNPNTIDANSLLELESTNKGFLPPRVAINSLTSASPLTDPVTAGMFVYSTGGTVTDGYYMWNGTRWIGTIGNQPYGSVSSSVSQFVSSTTTLALITYDTDEILNQITHSTAVNTSRIGIEVSGTYLITFSAELQGAAAKIDVWLRQNGVDVPRSTSRSSLSGAGDWRILTVTYVMPAIANDYFELVQSSTNTSAGLIALGTQVNPTEPGTPSIIVTINKISD